jgi:hypothetical protein
MSRPRHSLVVAVLMTTCSTMPLFAQTEQAAQGANEEQVATLQAAYTELPPTIKELRFLFACEDGLQVKAMWFAENVGDAAPRNFLIAENSLTTKGPLNVVSLTRPTNGWPLGLYRLEIRQGDQLIHAERYIIESIQPE